MKDYVLPLLILAAVLGFLASIIGKQECLGDALMTLYMPRIPWFR